MNLRKSEVRFMGHLITKDGLKPDPEKVRAMQEMTKPTSKKELLSLLRFVNYLSKFLPRLSEVAQPLREMTAKEAKFIWSRNMRQHSRKCESLLSDILCSSIMICWKRSQFNAMRVNMG